MLLHSNSDETFFVSLLSPKSLRAVEELPGWFSCLTVLRD